ncbi:unannotated protein [freshwater metagenome]|uniref:Unannotated protein n=1 Tax=freshwater metagenome TaxID=449393 RepID=A0A6J7C4K6_9ZZZZ
MHLRCSLDRAHHHTAGDRQIDGGDQGDAGAASGCLGGDGVALLATAAVGNDTDGVDRLTGSPSGDHHVQAGQIVASRQNSLDRGDDALGCSQATSTDIAAGQTTLFGFNDVHTPRSQRGDVGLHGWVLPHFGVHRRADHHGRSRGKQHIGEQIGTEPGRIRGQEAGRCRSDDDQISGLPQHRVRDGACFVPQAGLHWLAGQGRQCGATDEVFCTGGHHRYHVCSGVDKTPGDLDGLIGRDATGDTQHDSLAGEHDGRKSQASASAASPSGSLW